MSRHRTSDERATRAAKRLERRAGGPLEIAIVCGSGLAAGICERIDGSDLPYAKLDAPATAIAGHPGFARVGTWRNKRVVAFAGRIHLYSGHDAWDVTYLIRLAAAVGVKTVVLTNAAGGLNPGFAAGDAMLVADHLNLTGTSPIEARANDPFVDMVDAYAPHLRALAREHARDDVVHEGIYAGVRGPQYETPAESHALRALGADAVGMSTVLETIAARALGLDVLGLSLITNVVGSQNPVSHVDVLAASQAGSARIARIIEGTLTAL